MVALDEVETWRKQKHISLVLIEQAKQFIYKRTLVIGVSHESFLAQIASFSVHLTSLWATNRNKLNFFNLKTANPTFSSLKLILENFSAQT